MVDTLAPSSFSSSSFYLSLLNLLSILLPFLFLPQIASLVGVFFMVGVYLTVFSYWLSYPEWVGPLVMLCMMSLLFAIPVPFFYYRSRIWLTKLCVSPATSVAMRMSYTPRLLV